MKQGNGRGAETVLTLTLTLTLTLSCVICIIVYNVWVPSVIYDFLNILKFLFFVWGSANGRRIEWIEKNAWDIYFPNRHQPLRCLSVNSDVKFCRCINVSQSVFTRNWIRESHWKAQKAKGNPTCSKNTTGVCDSPVPRPPSFLNTPTRPATIRFGSRKLST